MIRVMYLVSGLWLGIGLAGMMTQPERPWVFLLIAAGALLAIALGTDHATGEKP